MMGHYTIRAAYEHTLHGARQFDCNRNARSGI